jgi:ABC-type multidrug transport system fused ATPase/permease subunit
MMQLLVAIIVIAIVWAILKFIASIFVSIGVWLSDNLSIVVIVLVTILVIIIAKNIYKYQQTALAKKEERARNQQAQEAMKEAERQHNIAIEQFKTSHSYIYIKNFCLEHSTEILEILENRDFEVLHRYLSKSWPQITMSDLESLCVEFFYSNKVIHSGFGRIQCKYCNYTNNINYNEDCKCKNCGAQLE